MYEQEIVLRRIQWEVYALLSKDDYKGWQEADWKIDWEIPGQQADTFRGTGSHQWVRQ